LWNIPILTLRASQKLPENSFQATLPDPTTAYSSSLSVANAAASGKTDPGLTTSPKLPRGEPFPAKTKL
jgi:hypothetical protein